MSKELAKYGIKTVTNLATAEENEVPYVEDRRRYVHHDQRPYCYCCGLHRGFVGVSVMSCCRGPFAPASPPGHISIIHTTRYTALSPSRFKDFWRD